ADSFWSGGSRTLPRRGSGAEESRGEEREHELVVAADRVPAAGAGGRPHDDVRLRTILAHEIQIRGRQLREGDAAIAGERDRFQEDLRQHDGGAAVQVHTALEPRDVRDEVAEIAEAALAERRA